MVVKRAFTLQELCTEACGSELARLGVFIYWEGLSDRSNTSSEANATLGRRAGRRV